MISAFVSGVRSWKWVISKQERQSVTLLMPGMCCTQDLEVVLHGQHGEVMNEHHNGLTV